MKKLIYPLTFLSFLINPAVAFAQDCTADETFTDLGCISNDPFKFVQKFYGIGLGLIGGVSILFIIYGGYLYILSQGEPQKLKEAKEYIYYAVAGLLLAILGFVFIQFVVIDILNIPGFE